MGLLSLRGRVVQILALPAGALVLLLLAGLAAPAEASTVGRFFAHEDDIVQDVGFGVAETVPAAEAFDVPIFVNERLLGSSQEPRAIGSATGVDGVARLFNVDVDFDVVLSDIDASAGTATASYTVTLPSDFLVERQNAAEEVYLFFATSRDPIVNGVPVPYFSPDVGIDIDSDDPDFGIIQSELDLDKTTFDLFYPAVRLANGGIDDNFVLEFDVKDGLEVVSGVAVVPDLLTGAAYVTVIPEPATAGMLAVGLLALAVAGRRR